MATWSNSTKTASSYANQSRVADFAYMAGKVGYAKVGQGRVGATVDGSVSGTLWNNNNKY